MLKKLRKKYNDFVIRLWNKYAVGFLDNDIAQGSR
jgi:hypothetical protein